MLFSCVLFLLVNVNLLKICANLVDRLDLFIKRSYFVLQCNENEIQIVQRFETIEEFQSNFQCTNKNEILGHGIDKIQVVSLGKLTKKCHEDDFVRIESDPFQVKSSLSKEQNGVDWPRFETPFTKEILKSHGEEFHFNENPNMKLILLQMNINDLPEEEQYHFIHLTFVNRPLICRLRITGLKRKLNDGKCDPDVYREISQPICYYRVGGKTTPTDKQYDPILQASFNYLKEKKTPYAYITNINDLINDDQQSEENDQSEENNEPSKGKNPFYDNADDMTPKKEGKNAKSKEKKKKSPVGMLITMIVVFLLFVLICIGSLIFYKKFRSNKANDQLNKSGSDSSIESGISNSNNSVQSEEISDDQSPAKKKKKPTSGVPQMFKVDDEL